MFLIRQHLFRSRYFIFSEGLAARIAQLLSCPQKHLKLSKSFSIRCQLVANDLSAALKFFRACVGLQDDFYNRQLITNRHFEPILNILFETKHRDNLLNSACLEFFECIKRDNTKSIITHLGDNYRERLQQITYVDTFQMLMIRYDQFQDGFPPEMDTTLYSNDNDNTVGHSKANGNHRWQGVKEMDPAQEAYFNTSDDEDETASSTKKKPLQNGSSPLLKSLVDYPDDDEDAMDTIKPSSSDPPFTSSSTKSENNQVSSYSPVSIPPSTSPSSKVTTPLPQTPPERLSEKRRREEDDEEDELGKLALTKRRSSSGGASSVPNSITGQTNLLRRKKSFALSNSSKDSSTGAKKIEISLASVKPHTEPDPKRDEGG